MNRSHGFIRPKKDDSIVKVLLVVSLGVFLVSCAILLVIINFADKSEAKVESIVTIEKELLPETVDVLLPRQDITPGTMLEANMFIRSPRPRVGVSGRVVTDYSELMGKYSKSLILADQPVHIEYMTDVRPVNAITSAIPEGYRAVTIKVDEKTGIEGWARPGAKVDVTWSTRIRDKQAVTVIVENARVLSASRQIESDVQGDNAAMPTELSLLVPVEDAKKIQLATLSGTVSLSLRGDRDAGKSTVGKAITTDDLLGIASDNSAGRKARGNTIKIRDNNGNYEDFVFEDGHLVPIEMAVQ